MTFYQRQGMLPPRRYTVLEREGGGYYHEELMSSEGFSGASSTLYRLNPPTRIRHVRDGGATQPKFYDGVPDNMLFRTDQVISSGDGRTARVPLFGNDDVLYSVCRPGGTATSTRTRLRLTTSSRSAAACTRCLTSTRCSPPVG
jgi:homogentisate 1,2-dioxygenase